MKGRRTSKKSKRISLGMKYKVEKKVREHKRKLKRDMKRHPEKYPRKKSDPGVPNSVPFKSKLIEEAKEAMEEEKKHRERATKWSKHFKDNIKDETQTNTETSPITPISENKDYSQKDFKEIVDLSDVVLQVLDARDPLSCRCLHLEEIIKKSGKKLIYLLTKVDRISKTNLKGWLIYLKTLNPTVIFKPSIIRNLTCTSKRLVSNIINSESTFGAENLIAVLNESHSNRSSKKKKTIVVGVVGLPDTGKKSVVSSLEKLESTVHSKDEDFPSILLNENIKLLTNCGIIIPKLDPKDESFHLRSSSIKNREFELPEAVKDFINRCCKMRFVMHYNLPRFTTVEGLLVNLSESLNASKRKSSLVTLSDVTSGLLQDWKSGNICYCTTPLSAEGEIEEGEDLLMDSIVMRKNSELVPASALNPVKEVEEFVPEEEEEEAMSEDEEEASDEEIEEEVDEEMSGEEEDNEESDDEGVESDVSEKECPKLVPIKKKSKIPASLISYYDNGDYNFNDFYKNK